jgi:hypothetical protein
LSTEIDFHVKTVKGSLAVLLWTLQIFNAKVVETHGFTIPLDQKSRGRVSEDASSTSRASFQLSKLNFSSAKTSLYQWLRPCHTWQDALLVKRE